MLKAKFSFLYFCRLFKVIQHLAQHFLRQTRLPLGQGPGQEGDKQQIHIVLLSGYAIILASYETCEKLIVLLLMNLTDVVVF